MAKFMFRFRHLQSHEPIFRVGACHVWQEQQSHTYLLDVTYERQRKMVQNASNFPRILENRNSCMAKGDYRIVWFEIKWFQLANNNTITVFIVITSGNRHVTNGCVSYRQATGNWTSVWFDEGQLHLNCWAESSPKRVTWLSGRTSSPNTMPSLQTNQH